MFPKVVHIVKCDTKDLRMLDSGNSHALVPIVRPLHWKFSLVLTTIYILGGSLFRSHLKHNGSVQLRIAPVQFHFLGGLVNYLDGNGQQLHAIHILVVSQL